jgi:uncharacterized protein (TIGR00251 family)
VSIYRITDSEIHLDIKAVPGASKTEFAGLINGRLRVKIAAAPEDGRANAKLIDFFAQALDCSKRELRITNGEKSRLKTLALPLSLMLRLEEIIAAFSKQ